MPFSECQVHHHHEHNSTTKTIQRLANNAEHCFRRINRTPRTTTSQQSRAKHQYRLNMPMNRVKSRNIAQQHSKRTRQTCAGVTRIELFTVHEHTSTPHPMHMHTVAPNRLQDDLCNPWRLHISHCQHTPTHRSQASKPLPILKMPRDEQANIPLRNRDSQTKLACQRSTMF